MYMCLNFCCIFHHISCLTKHGESSEDGKLSDRIICLILIIELAINPFTTQESLFSYIKIPLSTFFFFRYYHSEREERSCWMKNIDYYMFIYVFAFKQTPDSLHYFYYIIQSQSLFLEDRVKTCNVILGCKSFQSFHYSNRVVVILHPSTH